MSTIEIKNLTKKIGNNYILKNINITMESGKVYGIQGVNGSGKTMLMRSVIGLIHPTEGQVIVDGKVIGRDIEFPESIGFLIENPTFLPSYTGIKNLEMISSLREKCGKKEIEEILDEVGLKDAGNKKYKKYSLGMKQRLGIAAAVFEKPDIVILDEPTNALDSSGIEMVKNVIRKEKQRGALVIISCHDTDTLMEVSDEVYKISVGEIVEKVHLS